ncbi:hypothetical protein BC833DRAFT_620625 [Globomyces pollinis-pini]|nr:hypothetical protein BC833DRAFT_620625 [Globomyces pollinis-pini]
MTDDVVYSAIYSGVPVYEVLCKDISVMRRMGDSYMNATQILKLAGFSKPQRTKILETEVLQGLHEKIQGGYGKYQGTWIPLEAGTKLAVKYGVDEDLRTILQFNPAEDSVATKPAALKKSKKQIAVSATPTQDTTDPDNYRARSRAVSASTIHSSPIRSFMQIEPQQEPTPIYAVEKQTEPDGASPSSVSRRLFDEESTQNDFFSSVYLRREKFLLDQEKILYDYKPDIPRPLPLSEAERKAVILQHIVVEDSNSMNIALVFEYLRSPTNESIFELNLELDARKSTPTHWAAGCGQISLLRHLIGRGASIILGAVDGETPFMRAINMTANFTNQTMDQIVRLLSPSMFKTDDFDRTILHYLANLGNLRSKRIISHYYMKSIVAYIEETNVKQQLGFADFIDQRDSNNDTALHIACRTRNHRIAALLIKLGASKVILNESGDSPMSLSVRDIRLRRLLDSPEAKPDNKAVQFDDYSDAPTTPTSDISNQSPFSSPYDAEPLGVPTIKRRLSSSTLSTMSAGGFDHISRFNDAMALKTAHHLSGARLNLSEIKYHKERFKLVSKYANKIEKKLSTGNNTNNPSTISSSLVEGPRVNEMEMEGGAELESNKRIKLERNGHNRTISFESKLNSQLIRLESLINASIQQQGELLTNIRDIKEDRLKKDLKYNQVIGGYCHIPPIMVEESLIKCADFF